MSRLTVSIIEAPDCLWESNVIRTVLEGFEIQVVKYTIGRPFDFIKIINGNDYLIKSDYIIFCFHGVDGEFVMPKLHPSIYEENEPRDNLGSKEIREFYKIKDTFIINTGCTLGNKKMAKAFLDNGCNGYIGAVDYIEGNSPLFFIIRLFYEMTTNQKTLEEAFELSRSSDKELQLFQLYN